MKITNRLTFGILAAAALLASSGAAFAQGDAAAGEAAFRVCSTCHAVGEGATNKVGPVLNGVVGRTAGTVEGYNYSDAMKQAGANGLVWQPDTLATFLENPREHVPGTKMAYPGLKDQTDRENVIAYLATFSSP